MKKFKKFRDEYEGGNPKYSDEVLQKHKEKRLKNILRGHHYDELEDLDDK